MALIPYSNVAGLGIIRDQPGHVLPPGAWSDGRNVRFFDGYVGRLSGETSVMPTVAVAPIWLLPYFTASTAWWIYAGAGAVYATDGTAHHDISGATYGASLDNNWSGGMFNSVPVMNNPVDGPFYLSGPTPATQNLTALPNWTYGSVTLMKCRVMRPFKNYLVALDVTKTVGGTSTRYAQLVKWSHAADPGSLPISWNEADTRYDTGEFPLADTDGAVLDCLPLRDLNVVYKNDSTYLMQWIGGAFVFRFSKAFSTFGMLADNCAANTPQGSHLVLAADDVVLHNGSAAESAVDKRMRRNLFSRISSTSYTNAFVAANVSAREIWVCIPESGATTPNLAYVWNWRDNTWTIRDLNSVAFATSGVGNTGGDLTWNAQTGTWDAYTRFWDAPTFNPSTPFFIGAHPSTTQLRQYDTGGTFNGTAYTSWVERTGIGVPIKAGEPPDISSVKFLRGLWPRIEGTNGGVVKVYVGTQFRADEAPTWQSPKNFTIGSSVKIDCRASGRMLALRFEAPGSVDWRLHGYDLDLDFGGNF